MRGKLFRVVLQGCFVLAGTVSSGSALAQPVVMETYGDSLTAGFLTATTLTAPPPLRGESPDALSISRILRDLMVFLATKDGDALSREHSRELAWPTQLALLQASPGTSIEVRNLAISGALSGDLLREVLSAPDSDAPTEAFFYIGHNDLCDNPRTPESMARHYFQNYSQALAVWDQRHHDSVAYVVPLMNVERLYKTLKGTVWYQSRRKTFTCETSWDQYFPYCVSHHTLFREGRLGEYVVPRVAEMNRALRALVQQWNGKTGGRNHYYYIDGIYDQPIQKSYFAVDCYHLSAAGQSALAQTFFSVIPKPLEDE